MGAILGLASFRIRGFFCVKNMESSGTTALRAHNVKSILFQPKIETYENRLCSVTSSTLALILFATILYPFVR
jgi:hypothetical protein